MSPPSVRVRLRSVSPSLKLKLARPTIRGKMTASFPANVEVLSPILLDRAGGSYTFSFDMDAVTEAIGLNYQPLDSDLTAIAALTTTSYGRSLLILANATALAAEVDSFFLTPAEGNAAYQPLDSDLTAIAALATATYGRSLLTLANATALAAEVDSFFLTPAEGNAAYQPLGSDLTAIAALTTTSFGRAFLALADAAAARTAIALGNVDNTSDANKPVSTATQTALNLKANLASPTFTGTPAAPTAAVDTNTTQLATTAMVLAQAAAATPLGNAATAVVGTSTRFARADHVHPGREVLTAARTYYARSDGSDSNTGLANTSGGAFLTIQKAIDVVAALDISIYTVTIQLGDGTYTAENLVNGPWLGSGSVTINGNSSTPANVIVTSTGNTILAKNNASVTVSNFEVRSSSVGLFAARGGNITLGAGMRFGACTNYHMSAESSGSISYVNGAYSIAGAAVTHVAATAGGIIQINANTVTITGTPAFGFAFVSASRSGLIEYYSNSFSGSATGTRYSAAQLGNIFVNGAGATYLPGNSAGSTATGGQYV